MRNAVRGRTVLWALAVVMALLFTPSLRAQERRQDQGGDPRFAIHLKSGTFTPSPGVEPALRDVLLKAARGTVGLLQLDEIPDESQRAQLERAGVALLDYVPNNAWIVRLPADLNRVTAVPGVRWVGRLLVEDKLSPDLSRTPADKKGRGELTLAVEAVEGSLEGAVARVQALGGRVLERNDTASTLRVKLPRASVRGLAESDAVLWISTEPPKTEFNDRSRANTNANTVQAVPYGLNGSGVQLGIWDGGEIFAHTDFGTRLTVLEPGTISDHATHVTGTMAGDGTRSTVYGFASRQFRGYSTAADIIGYDFNGSPDAEHNGAISTYGIDLSQNSWGFDISTANANCSLYGDYHALAREYDRIVTGLYTRRIPVIFAAGNERDDGDCGLSTVSPFLNYAVVSPPATAKDVISVGAINGDNSAMTLFSSWGPTDDGRVKPELVAPGCNATAAPLASIVSTYTNNGYAGTCGTSMAAPAVSGSVGLLLQRYRAVCPGSSPDPLPGLVKALLVDTARDLDDASSYLNRGPDYASGYGALDIKAAVDMLPFYREDQVSNGQTDTFQITVTQQQDLKVTLVWDDPAAVANAAVTLVNDLDLELVDPLGGIHRPWVLNPGSPASNATRAADHRNVVEQVVVDNVTSSIAGVWTIRVIGTSVPSGPQRYALVTQHLRNADLSCQGAPASDAWIMDKDNPLTPVDPGTEPNPDTGPMWISNQIWVRHAADGIMVHQDPEYGQPNYVYARVRNRGTAQLNTVRVMVYAANASAGLSWPKDWTLIGEQTIVNLPAGSSRNIDPVVWSPPATGHYCLYVRLLTDQDPIHPEGVDVNANTRNNNNIAWRNVNIVDLLPNSQGGFEVLFGNVLDTDAELTLNVDLLPDREGRTLLDFATVTVRLSEELLKYITDAGIRLGTDEGFKALDASTFQLIRPTGFFTPLPVPAGKKFPLSFTIQRFVDRAPSPLYTLDLNQNFAPLPGKPGAYTYDPKDPNVGGVRYEVSLPAGTGTVTGQVLDADGAPIPGATVTVEGTSIATVADAGGSFRLEAPAGTRVLVATVEGLVPAKAAVEVTAGGGIRQDLTVPKEEPAP